jgi:hypothetical protein
MSTTKVQSDMVDIDGATTSTIVAGDKINFLDITDSLVKEDTVQGILDLGGGAWNIIGTAVASGSATLDITGLDSTYDTYAIALQDMVPANDGVLGFMRLGDSGGFDSGASDYAWQLSRVSSGGTAQVSFDQADSEIEIAGTETIGNAGGEGLGGMWFMNRPGDGTIRPAIHGMTHGINATTQHVPFQGGGGRLAVIVTDRIQFLFSAGNVATGRMTVWGVAHA